MGLHKLFSLLFALLLALAGDGAQASPANCHGKWANPITDICWSCMFPMTLGPVPIVPIGPRDLPSNPPSPLCMCGPRPGITTGFWEPARVVEVTRTPFCMPTLGGLEFPVGWLAPHGAIESKSVTRKTSRGSFYQAHLLINVVMSWLEVLLDAVCLEPMGIDVAYMTEFDPLWNDDALTAILQPEAILFANPLAIAACIPDCVTTSAADLPLEPLFWCSGCQGGIFPMDGRVPTHDGGVRAAALITHKMIYKMHRQLVMWQFWGPSALCSPHANPLMTKGAYRTQLLYPIPGTLGVNGQCCQTLGNTTMLYGALKEFPVQGEDWAFTIFRKRNCCAF